MHSQQDIYQHLSQILIELFEIEPGDIKPDAKLYEDLDIDSIDAVDMAVKLKELTGRKIQPSDFKQVQTVQDVVDTVFRMLQEENDPSE